MKTSKMKVEIWSDIMCPFCYIGKRNFESAIKQFGNAGNVEVEWKSFQLDPSLPQRGTPGENVYHYLAQRKGISYETSVRLHENVVQMAQKAGLEYNFDKATIANSFSAHRLIQLAKTKGPGDAAEERLFLAYFTQGKDFGDPAVLIELGKEIGLTEADVNEALNNASYSDLVNADIQEGEELGLRGVPFFVLNRRYAVSGAQPPAVFLQALQDSFAEWREKNPALVNVADGDSCVPGEDCI